MANTGQTGRKFQPTEREEVIAFIASMDRLGYGQWDIAQRINTHFRKEVSRVFVSRMLKKIRMRYIEQQSMERAECVATMYERYMDIYREAYDAWCRSVKGLERVTTEEVMKLAPKRDDSVQGNTIRGRVKGGKVTKADDLESQLQLVKRLVVREGRAGASEFLNVMDRCLTAIREMRGLDEPKKVDMRGQIVQVDWNQMLQMEDTVEAKLRTVESNEPLNILNGDGHVQGTE